MQSSKLGMWKGRGGGGVPFVMRVYRRGGTFSVRSGKREGLGPRCGASMYQTMLSTPPGSAHVLNVLCRISKWLTGSFDTCPASGRKEGSGKERDDLKVDLLKRYQQIDALLQVFHVSLAWMGYALRGFTIIIWESKPFLNLLDSSVYFLTGFFSACAS